MNRKGTVWVTGASSGLGLHTAMALRDAGWNVIAGARSFQEPESRDGMTLLPLDVTREESVRAFRDRALAVSPEVSALVFIPDQRKAGGRYETVSGRAKRLDPVEKKLILLGDGTPPREAILSLDRILDLEGIIQDDPN